MQSGKTTQVTIHYKDGSKRVIKPQLTGENSFKGDWKGLVEAVTGSDIRRGFKNYLSFEVQ